MSENVNRYFPWALVRNGDASTVEASCQRSPDGDYVLYDDYTTLRLDLEMDQAAHARVVKELQKVFGLLMEAKRSVGYCADDGTKCPTFEQAKDLLSRIHQLTGVTP